MEEETNNTQTQAVESHQPSAEEIERTKKVMQDSLAARKPKGFMENLKDWFR